MTQATDSPAQAPTAARDRLASSDGAPDGGVPPTASQSHSLPVSASVGRPEGRPTLAGTQSTDRIISIELSKVQIDRVMRSAAGEDGHVSAMLREVGEARDRMMATLRSDANHHLSRSLLSGLLLLASFPRDGSYLGNAEVARLIGMNASTTHRYVSTLVEAGLVERHPSTRRYRLAQ